MLQILPRNGFWVRDKWGSPLFDVDWLAFAIVSRKTLEPQADVVRAWWALGKAIQRGRRFGERCAAEHIASREAKITT